MRMTLSLAFLAPDIVKAAVEGRLPRGYGLKRLVDLPMAWPDQWRALGSSRLHRGASANPDAMNSPPPYDRADAKSNLETKLCGQRLQVMIRPGIVDQRRLTESY